MKHALRESFGTGYRREVCVCVLGGVTLAVLRARSYKGGVSMVGDLAPLS